MQVRGANFWFFGAKFWVFWSVLGVFVCFFWRSGEFHVVLGVRQFFRVFLNLWFAKPMVSMRVAFHENDGNRENDENDEDNSDSYKQGVE